MGSRVSSKISALVYGFCVLFFQVLIILLRNEFRSSLIMISVAGFLGSMSFFFLVVCIGQIYVANGKRKKPGFIAIIICACFAYYFAFYVHPISFFFCLCFSVPMIIYLAYASNMRTPEKYFCE